MKIEPPKRATRTYTQTLVAPPEDVFPLLCPVREADWIAGWNPDRVFTESGVAEADCVFLFGPDEGNSIWYITRHDPKRFFVEMLKITPGVTACRLDIQLREENGGSEADVTYSHTSLGPEGDKFVDAFTVSYYVEFMEDWERRLNHFLTLGTALPDERDS